MERFKTATGSFWSNIGRPRYLAVFIALWAAFIIAGGLPHGDLSGYDDAAYAHEARAMVRSGDIWTLSLNGEADFDKPPLFIWMVAASFKVFGVNDPAAKAPAALLGWLTILLVYFLARELFARQENAGDEGEWIAVFSMLVMATTQYFLKYASHAMTDVPFTFFFTLAMYFFVLSERRRPFLLAAGAATGMAMLIRSPMGIFPAVIIIAYLACSRRFDTLFSWCFLGFVLFASGIPAIWYLREYSLFGDIFLSRHIGNFWAHSATADGRSATWHLLWYFEYVFLAFRLYMPWIPFMFVGMYISLKKASHSEVFAESLLFIWMMIVIVPFSMADSKVFRYIMPVFPVFAIFSAYALDGVANFAGRAKFSRFAFSLMAPAALFVVLVPNFLTRAEDMREIAPLTDAATAPGERVYLYTYGQLQWNIKNQLIWYGNRNADLSTELPDVSSSGVGRGQVVVMDISTFAKFSERAFPFSAVIGESRNFVCFRFGV